MRDGIVPPAPVVPFHNDTIRDRLTHELARARRYQKPLSVAVVRLQEDGGDEVWVELRDQIREADIVGPIDRKSIAII